MHGQDVTTPKVDALEAENVGFRRMLVQGGIGASQLLAKAGINATEQGCRAFAAPIVWKECTIDRVKYGLL